MIMSALNEVGGTKRDNRYRYCELEEILSHLWDDIRITSYGIDTPAEQNRARRDSTIKRSLPQSTNLPISL